MDKRIIPAGLPAVLLALGLAASGPAPAATPAAGGPLGLGGAAAADSLRTNVWLVEALMGEIVAEAAASLPPPPARVQLSARPAAGDRAGELLGLVVARVLRDRGYEVLVAAADTARGAAPDVYVQFVANQVELSYPDVGRALGLWRRWVARDVRVVVSAEISEAATGRLLLSERLSRRFSDRVTNDEFPRVDSRLYPFTTATVSESGWQRRLEEFAVLGTLAGLIAVYFANTGS